MNSGKQTLRELESRRKALNEQLMNSGTLDEANKIERELWAVRAAIRIRRSNSVKGEANLPKSEISHSAAAP